MNLLTVDTLEEAREKLISCVKTLPCPTESVTLDRAVHRVLATDVVSQDNIPHFRRSTVDGYAVIASDTQGASESIPTFLTVVEEIHIGKKPTKTITSGQCTYVPTGGMIPDGATAMVMVEYTEQFHDGEIAVYQSVAEGSSIVLVGEDAKINTVLLTKGTILKTAQVGVLAAAGIWSVPVYRPWRISILSTGDELVHPSDTLESAQVRDVNTWALNALASQCQFQVTSHQTIPDHAELLRQELEHAKEESDFVLTSGGSSQGKADLTCQIMDEVCDHGVMTHGLSLKPGKPTILAFDERSKTIMVGLPGHPVASLMVFQSLLVWLWKEYTHQPPSKSFWGFTTTNIPGAPGKTTLIPVKLQLGQEHQYEVTPIFGKSGLINTLVDADGYVMLDRNQEGLQKGAWVEVHLFGV